MQQQQNSSSFPNKILTPDDGHIGRNMLLEEILHVKI
jgi:hypothetical protein